MIIAYFAASKAKSDRLLAGIIFAPELNSFHLGGYPLGFWFAQQGAIYCYIAMIFIYAKLIGDIDRRFDVHEE